MIPSERTIKRRLRELRAEIDCTSDPILARVAWEVEHAIQWARSDTVGWPSPLKSAKETVALIRKELPHA